MSGLPDIDVSDWMKNTDYNGYNEDNEVIKVLCLALEECHALVITIESSSINIPNCIAKK